MQEPFDPFEAAVLPEFQTKELECPSCRITLSNIGKFIQSVLARGCVIDFLFTNSSIALIQTLLALMTEDGTGYLQEGFTTVCSALGCNFKVTKENLALRQLVKDIVRADETLYSCLPYVLPACLLFCFLTCSWI